MEIQISRVGKKTRVFNKMKHEESKIQKMCVKWFRLQYPDYVIHHSSNHKLYIQQATNDKLLGFTAGYPDLTIILKNKVLFIEVKAPKGKESNKQQEIKTKLKNLGHDYFIVRSFDEFIDIVRTTINATTI
jgi:hypothetical protein